MSADVTSDLLARRERLLGPGVPTFYDEPVHVTRGKGVWLWDAGGRRYLDAYNNVPHVGHFRFHRHDNTRPTDAIKTSCHLLVGQCAAMNSYVVEGPSKTTSRISTER